MKDLKVEILGKILLVYVIINLLFMWPFMLYSFGKEIKDMNMMPDMIIKYVAIKSMCKWLWLPKKERDLLKGRLVVEHCFNIDLETF